MRAWLRAHLDPTVVAAVVAAIVLHAVADHIEATAYARGIQAEADRIASEAMGG